MGDHTVTAIKVYQLHHEAMVIPEASSKALSSWLVTPVVPITDSGNQFQRVFFTVEIDVGNDFNTKDFSLFLSSLPDTNAPIIVDDCLMINGRPQQSYAGINSDPKQFLGQDPFVCYKPVDAVDVTHDLREDGLIYISALDSGGYTFCCSPLYLRTVKK